MSNLLIRNVPEELHRRIRVIAAERDTTINAQAIEFLTHSVEEVDRAEDRKGKKRR